MNLIVIGEPELVLGNGTRNNALNEILQQYINYNKSVTYISSYKYDCDFLHKNVRYKSVSNYTKDKRYILNEKYEVRKFFKSLLENKEIHIQFRLPSLYTLQIYFMIKDLLPINKYSFYIAGDWKLSLKFNFPKKKYLYLILPILQDLCIKNETCVFTGKALMDKNNHLVKRGFSFYSTTHTYSDVPNNYKSKFNETSICFIGRLEKLKNYNFFLKLANTKVLSHYHFHLLGDGPDKVIVEDFIKINEIKNVTLHGHIESRTLFNNIIDQCKYFVLPSYTEGTSKTLPEMMTRSTIPIAFKEVGANDFILGQGNGHLCDVNDINSVTDFINKVDSSELAYNDILSSCINYAKDYSLDSQLDKMFGFLYEK